MSVLSWGKPKLEKTTSTGGVAGSTWTEIDTPKEDTCKLTVTAGSEVTATQEGGEIVDIRYNPATYVLEFDLFVKKGAARPFEDNNGIISGEYAFRLTPEDTACEGFIMPRAVVKVEESYAAADGILLHYEAKALKPANGNMVQPYTESSTSTK
jgi:hypothetical protein